MTQDTNEISRKQHLRLKILLPMSIGLLIFLGLYSSSTSWYLNRQIYRDLTHNISNIHDMFHGLLDQRAEIMKIQLSQLASRPHLQTLMTSRQREELYEQIQPTYQALLENMQITQFTFYTPDKTVFLRMQKPNFYGDRATRGTILQAMESGKSAQGIELEANGSISLHLAIPWRQQGELIGYLELAQQIELLASQFFQQEKTELFMTINKDRLIREDWESAGKIDNGRAEWNLLANKVILRMSRPDMIPELRPVLDRNNHPAHIIKVEIGGQQFQGLSLPLTDSSGDRFGELLMLHNVTEELKDYRTAVNFFILLCLVLGGSVLVFTAVILGRTERQLEAARGELTSEMQKVQATNQQLEQEIEERKAAETALSVAHDELEGRVQERTEQLWLSLEQTRQARKQLSGVLASVADGLLVTDLDGNLQLINSSAEELFNCSAEDSSGQPLKTIIRDPGLLKRMEEALQQQLADLRIDFTLMSNDLHKAMYMQARTSIISGSHGEATGMIFLIQDISHEREMERIKSEFISTAVHELSTPLTAIMGYSELLLSGQEFSPEDTQEFLAIINEKADFLTGLVGEMLDISRIESGKPLELRKKAHTAGELFERPILHFRHFSDRHQFSVEITDPQFELTCDREKIWQVMENLCSNAVKYSPEGGEIEIYGRLFENGYQVTVTDQGFGMTKDQIARVFEKFYRCNQSDTSIGGTGLGMTIVKSIIEAHDGQIWLESELGQGTSVHFILPCG